MDQPDTLQHLHRLISRHFSLNEIKTLCFYLGIDDEDIPGTEKQSKIIALLLHLVRRGILDKLLLILRKERPHVVWPDLPSAAELDAAAARLAAASGATETGNVIVYGDVGPGAAVGHGASVTAGDIAGRDVNKPGRDLYKAEGDMFIYQEAASIPGKKLAAIDVLLVTVTKVEAVAVLDYVADQYHRPPNPVHRDLITYYDLGEIGGAKTWMVRSEMGAGGVSGAMATILDSIADLNPTAIIMVGIAFGMHEDKQQIGEVLVSQRLLPYELQRIGTDEAGTRIVITRSDRPSASPRLLQRFRDGELSWHDAETRFGLLLSGEKLVDNIDFREQLRQLEPEAVGGEMEAAGLYAAAHRRKVDWIVVKAICDWADGQKHKNKQKRQQLAAHNAVSFVFHVIERGGLG